MKISFNKRSTFALASILGLLPMLFALLPACAQQVESPQTPANSAPAASSSTPTSAAGAGSTTGAGSENSAAPIAATPQQTPAPTTLSAGLDVYSGISNFEGQSRFSDGFWMAGTGPSYPSLAYLKLQHSNGSAALLSLGTGKLYRGSSRTLKQPVEAWYQRPVGKFTTTVGKFWVPFALQEWQYESKVGIQLQRSLEPQISLVR